MFKGELDVSKEERFKKKKKQIRKKKNFQKQKQFFFDTETNGLKANNSVLSISAIKTLVDFSNKTINILDRYERFYFPEEPYNYDVIRVNGLTKDYVTKKGMKQIIQYILIKIKQHFSSFVGIFNILLLIILSLTENF